MLVKRLELDELWSISSFILLLEAMVRDFHPDLGDTQFLQALMRRSIERENLLQSVGLVAYQAPMTLGARSW